MKGLNNTVDLKEKHGKGSEGDMSPTELISSPLPGSLPGNPGEMAPA